LSYGTVGGFIPSPIWKIRFPQGRFPACRHASQGRRRRISHASTGDRVSMREIELGASAWSIRGPVCQMDRDRCDGRCGHSCHQNSI